MDGLNLKQLKDQQKRIKPGECHKYMRLVVDKHLLEDDDLGQQLRNGLENFQSLPFVERQLPNYSKVMFWERFQNINESEIKHSKDEDWKQENTIIRILKQDELLSLAQSKSLKTIRDQLSLLFPDCQYIIFYMQSINKALEDRVEQALFEIQFVQRLNVVQVPFSADLATFFEDLKRVSKAVGERLYKQQTEEAANNFRNYLLNDNRNCVRVDGTNGLKRLWLQHLNRLPMVTLNVANAIMEEYPCPRSLMEAFQNNEQETINKIANLKVRRGCIPEADNQQTNYRRVGKVVAKKLHTLYTATDPSTLI